jgi:hypothetical protein
MNRSGESHDTDPEAALEARARRRVGIKMGFYIHVLVYVLVNLGLFVLNTSLGGVRWSNYPLWGWGLGLAIHGIVTFVSLQGDGMRSRMLAHEVEKLRRQPR